MKIEWKLQLIPIKSLKDHAKNPRQIKREQEQHLQNLIEKFGLIDKPIVNLDNTIIGGHQRIRILKKMNIKEVECWVPDKQLSDEDINHLCIGLNLNQGEFDFDILANQWDPIDLLKYGFTEDQLDFKPIELIESEEDDQTLEPPADQDAITQLGDIYELNGHRLGCGDSTDPEFVAKILNAAEPILMVTDPPYGVEYDPKWRCKVKGREGSVRAAGIVKNDDVVDWSLAYHLFPGSVAYVWHAGKHSAEVAKNLENSEYEIKSQIIWAKQHFALSRGDYHWQHEPCWYAVKKNHPHNWQGSRKESTLWEISNLNAFGGDKNEEERTSHSTQKPMECMARPIRNNTAPGEGVYDPFLGSGTTLIAAESLDRLCYGLELSPAYCDVIINRWINYMVKNNKSYKVMKNGEQIEWKKVEKSEECKKS